MHKVNILFLLAFFNSGNFALAIDIPDSMKQSMAQNVVGMPSLLNLVVSMAVVIAMIYFTGWIYSKLNVINKDKLKKITDKNIDSHRFTVLQSMPLGQQRHLYSIEMNGKILLVGSTPEQINLIKEFDKESIDIVECINKSSDFADSNNDKKNIDIDELYKKYKK